MACLSDGLPPGILTWKSSLATPTFGSMITRINNQRLKDKKPPMGFLNPWLYKVGDKAFTEYVTSLERLS